jgi:hypothetical protein
MSVIITGMHRSGTSATARVVDAFGLSSGAGTAMESAPDNPRGFFERRDVSDFNDGWLQRLGGSWWAPPRTTAYTWQHLGDADISRARAELDLFDTDGAPWYSKDPRTALLLPLWDRVALRRHPVIFCLRHPGEVATSLWLRNGFSERRALALWAAYTLAVVNHAGDRPVLVLDYAGLLEAPTETLASLEAFLRDIGHSPGPGWSRKRAAGLLEQPLRRAVAPRWDEDTRRPGNEPLLELYRDLTRRHGRSLVAPELAAPPSWVEEVLDELRELNEVERRRADAEDEGRKLRSVCQRLLAERGDSRGYELPARVDIEGRAALGEPQMTGHDTGLPISLLEAPDGRGGSSDAPRAAAPDEAASLRNEVTSLREEAASLRDEAASRRDEATTLREEVATLRDELASLRMNCAQLSQELAATRSECAKRRTGMIGMSAELERRRARAHRAEAVVAQLEQQSAELDARMHHAETLVAALREHGGALEKEVLVARFERDNVRTALGQCLEQRAHAEMAVENLFASPTWRWGRVLTAPARLARRQGAGRGGR